MSICESTVAVLVSTLGPSALTVTVSLMPPTGRTKSSVMVVSGEISTFSRTTVLKPASDALTV